MGWNSTKIILGRTDLDAQGEVEEMNWKVQSEGK